MKKNKFDRAERTLFESFEKDRWHSSIFGRRAFGIPDVRKSANRKGQQVNINLSKEDWEDIQKKAHWKGVPSEDLISNVVHQFVKGRLVLQ